MVSTQYKSLSLRRLMIGVSITLVTSCNPDSDAVRNSTDVAEACGESDLIAQCPPNSFPDLEARASVDCNQAGSINASQSMMSQVLHKDRIGTSACFVGIVEGSKTSFAKTQNGLWGRGCPLLTFQSIACCTTILKAIKHMII